MAIGLGLSGFWPNTPSTPSVTDRAETFAMATGPVDDEVEAVYFLDFLTGDLGGRGVGPATGSLERPLRRTTCPPTWASIRNEAEVHDGDRRRLPARGPAAAVSKPAAPCATWRKSPAATWRPMRFRGRPQCSPPASRKLETWCWWA